FPTRRSSDLRLSSSQIFWPCPDARLTQWAGSVAPACARLRGERPPSSARFSLPRFEAAVPLQHRSSDAPLPDAQTGRVPLPSSLLHFARTQTRSARQRELQSDSYSSLDSSSSASSAFLLFLFTPGAHQLDSARSRFVY